MRFERCPSFPFPPSTLAAKPSTTRDSHIQQPTVFLAPRSDCKLDFGCGLCSHIHSTILDVCNVLFHHTSLRETHFTSPIFQRTTCPTDYLFHRALCEQILLAAGCFTFQTRQEHQLALDFFRGVVRLREAHTKQVLATKYAQLFKCIVLFTTMKLASIGPKSTTGFTCCRCAPQRQRCGEDQVDSFRRKAVPRMVEM